MSKVMQIESKTEEILTEVAKSIQTSRDIKAQENNPEIVPLPQVTENLSSLTPAELAEDKINQQLASDQDYGAAAGALFALYGTRLYATIDSLSAKQLRRLIKALCVYPLEDQFINKKVPLEHQAYILANKMIESKFLITLYTGFEEEEKRKKAAEDYRLEQEKLNSVAQSVMTENKELFEDLAKQEETEKLKGENNG